MSEGETKECGRCKTEIIHVKIIKEWNGKKDEKLQWQNVEDKKPHFFYVGPNKYNCKMPLTQEERIVSQSEQTTMDETRGELNGETLPQSSNDRDEWVRGQTLLLLQIEKMVKEEMTKYKPKLSELNGGQIGMFVKEIYQELKRMGRGVE